MLDGTVNAMLLPVQDFHQQMHKASMAVADLAAVVLLPTPAEPVFHSTSNNSNLPQSAGSRRPSSKQQADPCVLQLLLSCRVFELLAAMADIAAVHGSRLAEQQALGECCTGLDLVCGESRRVMLCCCVLSSCTTLTGIGIWWMLLIACQCPALLIVTT